MVFGQLSSSAMLSAKFHAGTGKSLSDLWSPLKSLQFYLVQSKFHSIAFGRVLLQ